MGAHNRIYFVNMRHIAPTYTLTTTQKGKKIKKIGKSDHYEAIFRSRDMIFFVGAHNRIYFVNMKLFTPTSRHIAHTFTLTTPQKGTKKENQIIMKPFLGLETFFFVVAHFRIFLVNFRHIATTSTLTTP